MKLKRSHVYNGIFAIFIILLIIPQTRMTIQVGLNTVKAMFTPSVEYNDENKKLANYNWTLKDTDYQTLQFQDLQDEVIFVNLWATWCAPCVAEMPVMNELYTDYKDKVKFLFVSNENLEKVKTFKTKRGLQLTTFQPNTAYPSDLSSKTIPATFVIGRDGTIHVAKRGVANWNSKKVRDLLDRLILE